MGRLDLKPEQEGLGFFYGQYHQGDGRSLRVDVLPPKSFDHSIYVNASAKEDMHETDWIIYADGEEVARATKRSDVDGALEGALPSPQA